MDHGDVWVELRHRWVTFVTWSVSLFFDAIFLALWLFTNWIVEKSGEYFIPHGLDEWLFVVFKFIFAVSTLIAVLIYIIRDLAVMAKKAWRAIKT